MAKKKYVIANKNPKSKEQPCHHFLKATKKDQTILQELTHILEDLPEEQLQESVLSHVRSYGIVRDTFLSSVQSYSGEVKRDRDIFSYEEKKEFNEILALALEYLTDSNQQLYSKKEFQERFDYQEKGYKLYTAMLNTLQRHEVQQCLHKQFEAHAKSEGSHNLLSALEGAKLFLKKKASYVREEIEHLSGVLQEEISDVLIK